MHTAVVSLVDVVWLAPSRPAGVASTLGVPRHTVGLAPWQADPGRRHTPINLRDNRCTFPFETLKAYQLAVQVNHLVAKTNFPAGRAHLRDQAIRAADSMVLNIAEGLGRGLDTGAGRNHLRIARGSAAEVFAVCHILNRPEQTLDLLRRVDLMLKGLLK